MNNSRVRYSSQAYNQLAKLFNARQSGEITATEYRDTVEWFETHVHAALTQNAFEQFGRPMTWLYGLMNDPAKRVVVQILRHRTIQVIATRDELSGEIVIADIVFVPPVEG